MSDKTRLSAGSFLLALNPMLLYAMLLMIHYEKYKFAILAAAGMSALISIGVKWVVSSVLETIRTIAWRTPRERKLR